MRLNICLKLFLTSVFSLFFIVALGVLLSGISLWNNEYHSEKAVYSLLLGLTSCYGLSLINTKSFLQSILVALCGLIGGLLVGYFAFVPFGDWLVNWAFPKSNLGLSGSLSVAWVFLGPIVVVELLSDQLQRNYRWLLMLIGIVTVMTIVYIVELMTSHHGITNNNSTIKLIVYLPLTWSFTVGFANIRKTNPNVKHI